MKKVLIILLIVCVIAIGGTYWLKKEQETNQNIGGLPLIGNDRETKKENNDFCQSNCSPISGLQCDNYSKRPIMVMLGADEDVRPLSGLSDADMVIEMPVVTGGINRFAAVYLCNFPEEIGSVRSVRDDFIPLAKGFDAVLAHWGGSHFALDELATGVIDNIDALPNPFNVFYRKKGIVAPNNGFTSGDRLLNGVQKLGYRLENSFEGYPHITAKNMDTLSQYEKSDIITLNYPASFKVVYQYNADREEYLRTRSGMVEKDLLGNKDIYAKVVVIMEADSRQIEGQYNEVDIVGSGDAQVFQGGVRIDGRWEKKFYDSKLYFFNNKNKEIEFLSGQVWLQIIEPERNIY